MGDDVLIGNSTLSMLRNYSLVFSKTGLDLGERGVLWWRVG
jgi:hypothetical protein